MIRRKIDRIATLISQGKRSPRIRRIAIEIVKRVQERDYLGEVKQLFEFTKQRIRFTRDPYGVESLEGAEETLELGAGDCDALTVLLSSLLGAVGYPIKLKVISTTGRGWNHIYPLVGIPPQRPQTWIPADASVKRPLGYQPPHRRAFITDIVR
jgi:transglutaminase-like putative cysteine protease